MRVRTEATELGAAILAVSRALRLSPDQARRLLAVDRVLPAQLDAAGADALVGALQRAGAVAEAVDAPLTHLRCVGHPSLTADLQCEGCGTACCALCVEPDGRAQCRRCAHAATKQRSWRRLRLVPLTLLLITVLAYAYDQTRTRERKVRWDRPLRVALVPVATRALDVGVEAAWREGAVALEAWFSEQGKHWQLPLAGPVDLEVRPSVVVSALPDPRRVEQAEGAVAQAYAAFTMRRELKSFAPASGAFDVVLVVALDAVAEDSATWVEGVAQTQGDVGMIRGSDRDAALSLELIAAAHEILHTVGAADAYDEAGHALLPQGLAEQTEPLLPQRYAEVMAGEIPEAPGRGRQPRDLSEVRIGEVTARAIRWLTP